MTRDDAFFLVCSSVITLLHNKMEYNCYKATMIK